MEVLVLDQSFTTIAVIDQYESMIWTDRYDKPGDFEIYTPVNDLMVTYPKVDNYLYFSESDHLMIIEDITIEANTEDGNHIKIVGRSLESILDRRVITTELNMEGNLQTAVRNLLTTNIISPSDSKRRIPNFIFENSTDTAITSLTYENQFKGKDLLSIIEEICESKEIGFKVVLDDQNRFVFSLYKGIDRSYRQDERTYVEFKPSFNNIVNSNYAEIHSSAKTFCYCHATYTEKTEGGEGESSSSEQVEVMRTVGSGTGLLRKEVYKDSGVSKDDEMSMEQFYAKIDEAGAEELKDKKVKKTFDGECETTRMYVYKKHFYMGDVVQVANEYGMEAPSRVTEFIWSHSSSGISNYPTFTALDYEE